MHLGIAGCHIPFSGHCDLDLVLRYLILFKIGIPNFVCGCILGWRVSCTIYRYCYLTSDLLFRIIVSGTFLLYDLKVGIPNLACGCILVSKNCIESGAYLLYTMR